jgi:hypothetical protein
MKNMYSISNAKNLLVAVMALALIQAAQAQIFISQYGNGTIAQYNLNGTPLGTGTFTSGLNFPLALATDGGNLFVSDATGGINEFTLSGTHVGTGAIVTGLSDPLGLAITGTTMFVSNVTGTIGVYTTSGATLNALLITGLGQPAGLATSGSDLFVADGQANNIYEYLFNGTQVGTGPLISGLNGPTGLTIIGSNIFVTNYSSGTNGAGFISEYTLSGTQVGTGPIISGLTGPTDIATDGLNLFVTFKNGGAMEEFTTGGTLLDTISGLSTPFGILVVPEPSTWALLALGMGVLGYAQFRRSRCSSK